MEVYQGKQSIFIYQIMYAKDVLKKFNMVDCKPLCTLIFNGVELCVNDGVKIIDQSSYRSIVKSLIILNHTLFDIPYSLSFVSSYIKILVEVHMKITKTISRYVKSILMKEAKYCCPLFTGSVYSEK